MFSKVDSMFWLMWDSQTYCYSIDKICIKKLNIIHVFFDITMQQFVWSRFKIEDNGIHDRDESMTGQDISFEVFLNHYNLLNISFR